MEKIDRFEVLRGLLERLSDSKLTLGEARSLRGLLTDLLEQGDGETGFSGDQQSA